MSSINIVKIIKKGYKKASERYQNLSKEETGKRKYGHERYKNLSEDEKRTLFGYRKKYHNVEKNALL